LTLQGICSPHRILSFESRSTLSLLFAVKSTMDPNMFYYLWIRMILKWDMHEIVSDMFFSQRISLQRGQNAVKWMHRNAVQTKGKWPSLETNKHVWPRRMTASSSFERGRVEWADPLTSSFWMSGCNDPLFHVSWTTKYLVISYPTGIWELHLRSGELNCTYKLKYRPQNMLDTTKLGFQ
jgi:hypothetical protein